MLWISQSCLMEAASSMLAHGTGGLLCFPAPWLVDLPYSLQPLWSVECSPVFFSRENTGTDKKGSLDSQMKGSTQAKRSLDPFEWPLGYKSSCLDGLCFSSFWSSVLKKSFSTDTGRCTRSSCMGYSSPTKVLRLKLLGTVGVSLGPRLEP